MINYEIKMSQTREKEEDIKTWLELMKIYI